jgi:hypothetical protein
MSPSLPTQWPLPLSPATLIAVTIAFAALALFVATLIIRCSLSSFLVAQRPGCVVLDVLLPATPHL